MCSFKRFLATVLVVMYFHLCTSAPAAFKGDLLIQDLFISNPFEGDSTSAYNSTLSVIVLDEDHPELKPVHCQIEWQAGVGPPDSSQHQCENATTRAWFPENTFHGVENFQLQIAKTVIDPTLGECPYYCLLTKFAAVNITHPGTSNYECDIKNATCEQRVNTTIKVPIYLGTG